VKHFLKTLIEKGNKMITAAPETLFVFAAGNDGTDNDIYPTSPASIKATNVISVAAAYERSKLATFSNFGKTTVDVAAPGVIIESSIPGDEYLKVSGTSQAAPYIANVAGKIKDANPALTADEIKRIIMGTVDVKDYLVGKVKSNGIVNADRALVAAKLSVDLSLAKAIAKSKEEVQDIASRKSLATSGEGFVMPLPSTINF
jgi:subtilisin family serine protease